ncbi:unnamed protein product [Paramecium octaurelia]|uniref:Uncharacterized protein n=1 Tax=Paramecium octaurelia TaxID=43137 RepID=A0A8S1TI12_PAROT|nr:unnamed protein product [Paramecium octaurelia]
MQIFYLLFSNLSQFLEQGFNFFTKMRTLIKNNESPKQQNRIFLFQFIFDSKFFKFEMMKFQQNRIGKGMGIIQVNLNERFLDFSFWLINSNLIGGGLIICVIYQIAKDEREHFCAPIQEYILQFDIIIQFSDHFLQEFLRQQSKQNQTFIVTNHSRQLLHGYHVDDNIGKKLAISQGSELGGGLMSSVEVEQRKPKQVLQKEYDSRSIRYANEDYSYLANLLLSRFSQLDAAAAIATQYPLFKMLRGVTKKFMFNELEIIFFLHTIEEQKWRYDDQLISDFSAYFKQDFLSNQENQNVEGFKKLLLFLICCGYTIKCFFNDSNDQEIILITDHIQQYCQKDFKKSLLDLWRQKYMNCSLKIVPRVLNKLYNKLMRIPKDGKQEFQQDYNALVDQIIQISPAYNSQEGKQIKQEVKPIQQQPQQQQPINFSQQTQQSYQHQYMNNSGMFMQFSQSQLPQQNQQTFYPFPSQDFCDHNINDNLFVNSKIKEELIPPPPPLLSQSSNFKIQ